jgi:hypothetical protein
MRGATMMTSDLEKLIAKQLWNYFEFELPDTPQRVARALMVIVQKNGFTITKVEQ